MTEMIIDDTKRRFQRARLVTAIMTGITLAGFWPEVAFWAILINVVVWASWTLHIDRSIRQLGHLELAVQAHNKEVRIVKN